MKLEQVIRESRPASASATDRSEPTVGAIGPRAVGSGADAGLLALLKIEADARQAATPEELQFLFANEALKLTQARQIFVFKVDAGDTRLGAISGLPMVDHTAPLVQCMEQVIRALDRQAGLGELQQFDFSTHACDIDPSFKVYPFRTLLWLPLLSRRRTLTGGMLLASEREWTENHLVIGNWLAATYAHALALLLAESHGEPRLSFRSLMRRKVLLAGVAVVLAAMVIPVSMTTLAPFEIVATEPFVVAAPIDGVIRSVLVDANAEVAGGQPLVQFADIILRNRLEVAEQEMLVADARVKKSTQLAFEDQRGRQELGFALAELALKTTERDFAREIVEQATIKAPYAGAAVYSDKQALIGKPVAVGERIMLIADPRRVEVAIDVSVNDAIVLGSGARAKLFLDSDPLHSREAEIVSTDYLARTRPGSALAFRVVARLSSIGGAVPRLGTRGTAQLYGDRVLLAFYLFRRPLSALRQWAGL